MKLLLNMVQLYFVATTLIVCNQAAERFVFPCVTSAEDILSHYKEAITWIDTRFKDNRLGGRNINAAELSATFIGPGLNASTPFAFPQIATDQSLLGAYHYYVRRSSIGDRWDLYTKVDTPLWDVDTNTLKINSRTHENIVILARLHSGLFVRSPIVTVQPEPADDATTPSASARLNCVHCDLTLESLETSAKIHPNQGNESRTMRVNKKTRNRYRNAWKRLMKQGAASVVTSTDSSTTSSGL